jgi:hypothetical protein
MMINGKMHGYMRMYWGKRLLNGQILLKKHIKIELVGNCKNNNCSAQGPYNNPLRCNMDFGHGGVVPTLLLKVRGSLSIKFGFYRSFSSKAVYCIRRTSTHAASW